MNKQILLVEDDPGSQFLLRRTIEKVDPGAKIVAVGTAEEAYHCLIESQWEKEPFHLVVVDLRLPGSDGALLWEQVHKRMKVDFVFVSAARPEEWIKRIQSVHGDWRDLSFLQKPVSEEGLRQVWKQHFFT